MTDPEKRKPKAIQKQQQTNKQAQLYTSSSASSVLHNAEEDNYKSD